MRVERSLQRVGVQGQESDIRMILHPELLTYVFDQRGQWIERLEQQYKYRVDFREDPRQRRDEIKIHFPRLKKDVTEEFQV